MKRFAWNATKNEWLKKHRKISFEDVVVSLADNGPLEDSENKKHPDQKLFVGNDQRVSACCSVQRNSFGGASHHRVSVPKDEEKIWRWLMKLTRQEKQIEDSIDKAEWKKRPKKDSDELRRMAEDYVSQKKEARVNIRMAPEDIAKIREVAHQEGLPYQTLMSSILHKFVTGQLVEKKLLQELERMVRKGP